MHEDSRTGGDALDGVGAAEQLVEQEQVPRTVGGGIQHADDGFRFDQVVALAGDQIVRAAHEAADAQDRRVAGRRQARIDGLGQDDGDPHRAQQCRLAGHVRPGQQEPGRRRHGDAVRHRADDERMAHRIDHEWRAGAAAARTRPSLSPRAVRRDGHRRVGLADRADHHEQRLSAAPQLARPEEEGVRVEQEDQVEYS